MKPFRICPPLQAQKLALPLALCAALAVQAQPPGGMPPGGMPPGGMPPGGMPPGGMPPGGMPPGGMPPGGMPPGGPGMAAGPGGMMLPGAHDTAGIYISEGQRVSDKEYSKGEVEISVAKMAAGISGTAAEGVLLTSATFDANGLVLADGSYRLGGEKDYYSVYSDVDADYAGTSIKKGSDKIGSFNSVLLFGLNKEVAGDATINSTGVESTGTATLHIDNVYMQVDGSQRYVNSNLADSVGIINDSYLVSTGDGHGLTDDISLPFSNEPLLIDGAARTNFSIGKADTYYYNSTVIAEGWAALSTDACAGLNLVVYNTKAVALNGGYATYADFNCDVRLYGSELEAAEIGAIIAKSGKVSVLDGSAISSEDLAHNKGKTTKEGSVLKGGRNALMMHAPDMMGTGIGAVDYGYFVARNSTLATDKNLTATFDYSTYGAATQAYVDYIDGDVILIKSTSVSVDLENTELVSHNGVVFRTILNSDRMGNFLKPGDNRKTAEDGSLIVKPITLKMTDMDVDGDILHEDYHRDLDIRLSDVELTGRIAQGSFRSWKDHWSGLGFEKANWLQDNEWSGTNSLSVSLNADSEWTITGESTMSELMIAKGAEIQASKGYRLKMSVDGKPTDIRPGKYEGQIVIVPELK